MENNDLLREYYNEKVRGFAQRKFEELNQYQLKHLQSSFGYIMWRMNKALDTNLRSIRNMVWWK